MTPDLSNKELWANGWMVKAEPEWQVRIVDGQYRINSGHEPAYLVVAHIPNRASTTFLCARNGGCYSDSHFDLVPRPVKIKGFIAIHRWKPKEPRPFIAYASHVYATEDELSSECGDVVIPIEWEEPAQ